MNSFYLGPVLPIGLPKGTALSMKVRVASVTVDNSVNTLGALLPTAVQLVGIVSRTPTQVEPESAEKRKAFID